VVPLVPEVEPLPVPVVEFGLLIPGLVVDPGVVLMLCAVVVLGAVVLEG